MKLKKILISYSGHARSYEKTLFTHLKYFIEPLSKNFDLSIEGILHKKIDASSDTDVDLNVFYNIFEKYKCKFRTLESEEYDYVKNELNNFSHITHVEHRHGKNALNGICNMFYMVQKSFGNNKNYDFIVRMRPDLLFLSNVNENFLTQEIDADAFFPCFGHFSGGLNDQLFILKKNIEIKPFDNIKNVILLHPEKLLKNSILEKCKKINFEKSIDYVLALINGEINDQRNFSRKEN